MAKKSYVIYDICGTNPSAIRLLVHAYYPDRSDDWELFSGLVFRKEGDRIECEYKVDEWLTSMWQSPSGQIYVVCMEGHVHSNQSGKWEITDLGGRYSLNHVWGLDDVSVFCSGLGGVAFRKADGGWERFKTGLKADLMKIGGTASNDLYILGEQGKIFFFDGNKWSKVESPTNYHLIAILCVSRDKVYVCGRNGACFRGSKLGWQRISGTEANLWGLAQYQGKILVAARDDGILAIEGSSLVPFENKVAALGLRVIGNHLFSFAGTTLYEFNGRNWSKTELDFARSTMKSQK